MSREKHYNNGIMLAPDGQMLCRIGGEKAEWYLDHKLAHIEKEDPLTIRLNFEPKNRNGSRDPYTLAPKENKCVVCGKTGIELTLHHIVPYAYRKFLPIRHKKHDSHDVVLLCEKCHQKYEEVANKRKEALVQKHFGMSCMDLRIIGSVCNALNDFSDRMPAERKGQLLERLKNRLGKKSITGLDLEELKGLGKTQDVYRERTIVSGVTDFDEFVTDWRKHFLETMKPKYMPQFWDVNRKPEKQDGREPDIQFGT